MSLETQEIQSWFEVSVMVQCAATSTKQGHPVYVCVFVYGMHVVCVHVWVCRGCCVVCTCVFACVVYVYVCV